MKKTYRREHALLGLRLRWSQHWVPTVLQIRLVAVLLLVLQVLAVGMGLQRREELGAVDHPLREQPPRVEMLANDRHRHIEIREPLRRSAETMASRKMMSHHLRQPLVQPLSRVMRVSPQKS